jgi:purine-binding chemotaxis protein CheW
MSEEMLVVGVAEQQESVHDTTERVITFRINEELIGIDIRKIIKITKPLDITPVPNCGEAVVGVMNLRGNIITIVNPKKMLGLPENGQDHQQIIIVVDTVLGQIGILVEKIEGVATIHEDEIQPSPINAIGIESEFTRGVIMSVFEGKEQDLLVLLDTGKIFSKESVAHMAILPES